MVVPNVPPPFIAHHRAACADADTWAECAIGENNAGGFDVGNSQVTLPHLHVVAANSNIVARSYAWTDASDNGMAQFPS